MGYYPESIIYAENIDTLISLVELNRGITILHDSICRNNDLVSFNIFNEQFSYDIVLVRKKRPANPGVTAFEKGLP